MSIIQRYFLFNSMPHHIKDSFIDKDVDGHNLVHYLANPQHIKRIDPVQDIPIPCRKDNDKKLLLLFEEKFPHISVSPERLPIIFEKIESILYEESIHKIVNETLGTIINKIVSEDENRRSILYLIHTDEDETRDYPGVTSGNNDRNNVSDHVKEFFRC